MATFYIQLENKLLQISGELTAENIVKALGYVPVSPKVTNELSQRVDNITFDSLKDNPFLLDGSGELNIVDESGNIIAKIDAEGIHSVDFIAGEHKLSNKIDKTYVDEAIKNVEVDLTGYATEQWVENKNYLTEHQDISHLVTKDEIPTKVSDLENDSNYLTEHQDISHLATKDEVSNIDFYNINNNPIVNNGDGKLLFVDENGYIGLQLEENGLYVKDVIADGHTLSQKADKSDIPSLDGYATESYVNTNLQNYATKDEVSDLVDMSVVIELQGKVETLVGEDADKSVRDIAVDVLTETLVSETATEAYDTLAEMSDWIKSHPEDASAMNTAIQKNVTDITNLNAAYKAADEKVLTDAQEYADNINFYTIKDNPIVDGEAGSITFVDETGYIGLKFSEDGIIVKDVVTPDHKLSEKADKTYVDSIKSDRIYVTDFTIYDLLDVLDTGVSKSVDAVSLFAAIEANKIIIVPENDSNPLGGYVANTTANESCYTLYVNYSNSYIELTLSQHSSTEITLLDVYKVDMQEMLISGETIKTINGESILGSGDIVIQGGRNSDANVQAVDTGDVLDDVNVSYATTAYVDGLIGDINAVLESIINGGIEMISFTIDGVQYQAEEGMIWREWVDSEYSENNFIIANNMLYTVSGKVVADTDGTVHSIYIDDEIIDGYAYYENFPEPE